ncbi:MAG TPA: hypothetical protein DIW51_05575 [Rhodospirillaceae bacterium]|nr:hypothetical protein [Magnetovibrio sp.]HBT42046.1 hypothetical protein [Rhodospirillaceae bacterium]HCS69423.1 hypothetical protein [Rhodospirillaceae bacterium]
MKAFSALVIFLFGLTACVTAEFQSQGWDDLVACQGQTEAARESVQLLVADTLEKVDPEIGKAFPHDPSVPFFVRPSQDLKVFGADVIGLLAFYMHGGGSFLAIVKGDLSQVKEQAQKHGGFTYVRTSDVSKIEYRSPPRRLQNIRTFGSLPVDPSVAVVGSVLIRSATTENIFMIGCGGTFDNEYEKSNARSLRKDN